MKFYCLSDNVDTHMGMRLAGIDGEVIHTKDEVKDSIGRAVDDPELGVLLITRRLLDLCPELIYEIKLTRKRPLLVEIPDRHGLGQIGDSISRYVKEAIGLKF